MMKKTVTKLLKLVMALIMMVIVTIPAYAIGTVTITTTTDGAHSYKVYQLLSGDVIDDAGEQKLTNAQWGSGITNTSAVHTALQSTGLAADWAAMLATKNSEQMLKYVQDELVTAGRLSTTFQTVNGTGTSTTISFTAQGYYLILEDTTSLTGVDRAATAYVVRVVGDENITIPAKSGSPTVEKKVKENDCTTNHTGYTFKDGKGNGYTDVADYSIGDTVPFMLVASVPSNLSYYKATNGGQGYTMTFHDTLSTGLTYDNTLTAAILKSDGTEVALVAPSQFNTTISGQSVTVKINDLTALTGLDVDDHIIIRYNAVLNSSAVVGGNGNDNEVYLTYTNSPYSTTENGKTPTDKARVYTYALDVTKINSQLNTHGTYSTIAGAKFVLQKIGFDGSTPTDEFAIVSGGKITEWNHVSGLETPTVTQLNAAVAAGKMTALISDASGLISVAGLEDGHYRLIEIEAPTNYTLLANPVDFEIVAKDSHGDHIHSNPWDNTTNVLHTLEVSSSDTINTVIDEAANVTSGTVYMKVKNTSITQLPTTGGMGTTMLYVAGGAMILVSGILLVTKKRMENK